MRKQSNYLGEQSTWELLCRSTPATMAPPTLWGLDQPSTSKRLLAKILHANLTLGRDYKPRFKVWSSQGNIMGNLYTYDTHFILKLVTSVIRSKLSKLGSYIKSWEAGGIKNRRIGLWIVWSYIIWEKK